VDTGKTVQWDDDDFEFQNIKEVIALRSILFEVCLHTGKYKYGSS